MSDEQKDYYAALKIAFLVGILFSAITTVLAFIIIFVLSFELDVTRSREAMFFALFMGAFGAGIGFMIALGASMKTNYSFYKSTVLIIIPAAVIVLAQFAAVLTIDQDRPQSNVDYNQLFIVYSLFFSMYSILGVSTWLGVRNESKKVSSDK